MSRLTTDGFQVAPAVLSEATLAAARDAIVETIDRVAHALRTPVDTSQPHLPLDERLDRIARVDHAYAVALFHAVMADAQRDARIAGLVTHPRLAALVAEAVAPFTVTGAVVRTRASVPSLLSHRSRWHQDVLKPANDGKGCGSVRVACWIPLSDVDERSGALEVMPGAWTPLRHRNHAGQFSIAKDSLPADARRVVPMHSGDVLLLDRFIPHRSLPAQAPRARWAVVIWFKAAAPAGHA